MPGISFWAVRKHYRFQRKKTKKQTKAKNPHSLLVTYHSLYSFPTAALSTHNIYIHSGVQTRETVSDHIS